MKKLFWIVFAAIAITISAPAFADPPKCEGPADLCAQILQLQHQLDDQKVAAAKQGSQSDQKHKMHMVWTAGTAATIAIALKSLVSALKAWTNWLNTDKQKAVMKIGLLLVGFAAFILTNIGFGLPWWEALVVAGGPPGSILVHELLDLVAVLRGKKKLPPDSGDKGGGGEPTAPAAV